MMPFPAHLAETMPLTEGVAIPCLGLGVFRTGKGQPTQEAVGWALERGYRHIDTAHIYRNEEAVGAAIKASALPRSNIFLTTKVWNDDHGYDQTLRAFDASADALGVDTIDLYLIHWPVEGKRADTWRAMERLHQEGRVRAIGVSNFMVNHLEALFAHAHTMPAINQIELHPFCQQPDVVQWCQDKGVQIEAYSPLTKGKRLNDPTVAQVARALKRTSAQVLIRWSLQRGFVVIPKSSKKDRIEDNASVFDFELSDKQMGTLNALNKNEHLAWDPRPVP
jgi:diketogulonate reductase-like aldo/keto reductase